MSATTNPFEPPKASLDTPVSFEAPPPLWNPDAAGAWSLLLTPIFGSILLRKNWLALGDEGKARTGSVWIAVSILALIGTIIFGYLGLLYIIVWYFAWQKPQTVYIRERWGRDYPRKGFGRWVVALLGATAAYFSVVFVLVFVATLFVRR